MAFSAHFRDLLDDVHRIGLGHHGDRIVVNAEANLAFHGAGKSVLDIPPAPAGSSCMIVSAGPSIARENMIPRLVASGYRGLIVCIDATLIRCLKAGIIPDYCVTIDPHPTRMLRWFGDPDLAEHLSADDYFLRQDLDVAFRTNSIEENRKNLELVDRHASRIKLVTYSSIAESLARRIHAAGFDTYWCNPLVDDPRDPQSITGRLYRINRLPALNTGGNVGTAAWVFAHSVLGCARIGAIGMDYSYYPDLPLKQTQTYYELLTLAGDEKSLEEYFFRPEAAENPRGFYTDPTYMWYRTNFLDLLARNRGALHNCSEAGILYGPGVIPSTLERFAAGLGG
jgi:hypothetical protein